MTIRIGHRRQVGMAVPQQPRADPSVHTAEAYGAGVVKALGDELGLAAQEHARETKRAIADKAREFRRRATELKTKPFGNNDTPLSLLEGEAYLDAQGMALEDLAEMRSSLISSLPAQSARDELGLQLDDIGRAFEDDLALRGERIRKGMRESGYNEEHRVLVQEALTRASEQTSYRVGDDGELHAPFLDTLLDDIDASVRARATNDPGDLPLDAGTWADIDFRNRASGAMLNVLKLLEETNPRAATALVGDKRYGSYLDEEDKINIRARAAERTVQLDSLEIRSHISERVPFIIASDEGRAVSAQDQDVLNIPAESVLKARLDLFDKWAKRNNLSADQWETGREKLRRETIEDEKSARREQDAMFGRVVNAMPKFGGDLDEALSAFGMSRRDLLPEQVAAVESKLSDDEMVYAKMQIMVRMREEPDRFLTEVTPAMLAAQFSGYPDDLKEVLGWRDKLETFKGFLPPQARVEKALKEVGIDPNSKKGARFYLEVDDWAKSQEEEPDSHELDQYINTQLMVTDRNTFGSDTFFFNEDIEDLRELRGNIPERIRGPILDLMPSNFNFLSEREQIGLILRAYRDLTQNEPATLDD